MLSSVDSPLAQECLSVSGTRGSGKTTLVRALLLSRNVRRRIIQDPLRDYGGYAQERVTTQRQLIEYVETVKNSTVEGEAESAPFSVAYTPEDCSEVEAASFCAKTAYSMGNTTLVVEEAHSACNARALSRFWQENQEPPIVRYVKRGRHRGCALWTSAQRPVDVDPNLRAELNAEESYYFALSEGSDLDVVRKRRPGEIGRMLESRVASLPDMFGIRLERAEPEGELWEVYYVRGIPMARRVQ